MAQTNDLTKGNVPKLILGFFFPMLFTNMLQQIYTIADTAIVGKGLGDNALASVGSMSSLSFLIVGFSIGLCNGFSVIIAQNYGSKNYDQLRKSVASSVKLAFLFAVVLSVLSILLLRTALIALQTDIRILDDSLTYGYIIFGGLITTIFYNLCASILRALGDSKTPFYAIIVSTIVNIVLDYALIFIVGTGVEGAAIATIFAQVLSGFICLIKLKRIDIIRLTREDFYTDIKMDFALIKNGIPMACMNSITAVGCMVVQYFVNGLGVAYTSAYSACGKFGNLFMQPACTAGFTMSSFTSQNYGAKQYTRIKEGLHVCLAIAFFFYLTLGSLMVFFPRELAGLMLNGEEAIELAAQFLPISGSMLFAVDFLFVFRSGLQGMGYSMITMVSGGVEMVMRIATIVLFINEIGFRATAYADVVAWFGALALNLIAFEIILHKKLRINRKEVCA